MTDILMGSLGAPPRTRQRDYGLVVLQLLWQMRFDLLLFVGLVLAVLLFWSPQAAWRLTAMGVSVLGIAVSIFIAFRNTQAINRWWEARTLWGALINHSRQWRDLLLALLPTRQLRTRRGRSLMEYQVALAWLLNFELRNFWHADLRRGVDGLLADLKLPPDTSLQELCRQRARAVEQLYRDGWIDGWGRSQLMEVSHDCHLAIGGLERIRNTPLPSSYDVFVRLISWIYGLLLLLEFRHSGCSWVGVLLFLGFLIAERIGAYVEGPFDRDASSFSLPLNALCSTITRDLMQRSLDLGDFRPSRNPVHWT